MRLTITIDADTAAFADAPSAEVARILAAVVERGRAYPTDLHELETRLYDANGNAVGVARVDES